MDSVQYQIERDRQKLIYRVSYMRHVARMGEERKVYKVLVGMPEGKSPLGRPRKDGVRMDLREIGWGSVEWTQLAPDRGRWRAVVNTVMNLLVLAPRSSIGCQTKDCQK
jgi:hypothetical protein